MAHFVPEDALALWIGTAGTIPADWSRDTDYDDLYLQGVTDDSRGTGGGVHSHTTTHGHLGNAHTHTFSGAAATPNTALRTGDASGIPTAAVTHSHTSETSNSATITYVDDTDPTDAESAAPPFVRAIVIKPDDGSQLVPDGAFCFTAKSTAPTGFDITGDGGTVDYDGKFILGAVADGDGGGTGGTATHTHTKPNHTHQDDTHGHLSKLCGAAALGQKILAAVAAFILQLQHHLVHLPTKVLSDVSTDAVTVDAASSEPAYFKLLGIENTSGAEALPQGIILMYNGTIANIPDQWSHYAKLGVRQLKITKTPAEVGEIGGSDEHVHNVQAHGHTHTAPHNHGLLAPITDDQIARRFASPEISVLGDKVTSTHGHVWTIGTTTPTIQNAAAFDTGSSDKREAYREVIFIEYAPYSVHVRGDTTIQGGAIAA